MGLFDIFKKKTNNDHKPTTENNAISTDKQALGFYQLNINKVVRETTDSISVYLDIPNHLKQVFAYKAGQYITLRIYIDEIPYLRCYSLSSCPISDSFFRIAIKAKNGGKVSGYLVNNCKEGVDLDVFTPLGYFTPNLNDQTNNYLLFAGGSGITPILSIAKTILTQKDNSQINLIYANRNIDHIIYANELKELQNTHNKRLHVHHILEQIPANPEPQQSLQGIFKAEDYAQLVQTIPHFSAATYFICGPEGMMQAVQNGLSNILQVPDEQILIESFDFTQQSTHTADPTTHKPINADETANLSDDLGANATIILKKKQHFIHIPTNNTVLSACLDNGIDTPYMCEAGVCSSCRAKLVAGNVQMQVCYALSDKEIAEGYILTCQALALSHDIVVNYDN